MQRATQGLDSFGNMLMGSLQQSDTIYSIVLTANTSQQIALPTGANVVLFSVTGATDFWMKFVNSAISVPGSNVTDGSSPELNPLIRSCSGKGYVSLVAAQSCTVVMAFYS